MVRLPGFVEKWDSFLVGRTLSKSHRFVYSGVKVSSEACQVRNTVPVGALSHPLALDWRLAVGLAFGSLRCLVESLAHGLAIYNNDDFICL